MRLYLDDDTATALLAKLLRRQGMTSSCPAKSAWKARPTPST